MFPDLNKTYENILVAIKEIYKKQTNKKKNKRRVM